MKIFVVIDVDVNANINFIDDIADNLSGEKIAA